MTDQVKNLQATVVRHWNAFFFKEANTELAGLIRIAYAILIFVNMATLGKDLTLFFSEDGLLGREGSQRIVDPDTWSLLWWLPNTDAVLWACFSVMMIQIVLLGLGVFPRFQAAGVFIWLISFQHRHIILYDGEDTVFRLFAFYLIFMPTHRFSIFEWLGKKTNAPKRAPIWPYRLMQIQMCVIFLSTLFEKLRGPEWWNGTTMYYVIHLDDLFGKVPIPIIFDYMWSLKLMTWGTLVLEAAVPILVWFKKTRRPTLYVTLIFHLTLEITMNLNLFHWVMMLGWISFFVEEDSIPLIRRKKPPATTQEEAPEPAPG